jgi:large subunit ribosomal protein L17
MRHRVQAKHFNRDANHRKALLRNLVCELVEHGSIVTTKAKAKVVKGLADKVVSRAQAGDIPARHLLHRFFGKRSVVNTLVDQVAPTMADRKSGFTTMADHGIRRGDSTEMVKLSWVKQPEHVGSLKKPSTVNTKAAKPKTVSKTSAKAAVKASAKKAASKPVEKATEPTPAVAAKSNKVSSTTTKQAAKKAVSKVITPQQRTTNK